jgi:ribosome biogenesis GTPase
MTAEAVASARAEARLGCVLSVCTGVAVVLTDGGEVRATFGATMLCRIARDRSCLPGPGDWVVLRQWPDGPFTVEARATDRVAPVIPLRPR